MMPTRSQRLCARRRSCVQIRIAAPSPRIPSSSVRRSGGRGDSQCPHRRLPSDRGPRSARRGGSRAWPRRRSTGAWVASRRECASASVHAKKRLAHPLPGRRTLLAHGTEVVRVLHRRQRRVEGHVLRNEVDAPLRPPGLAGHLDPVDQGPAARRSNEVQEHVDRRRLAGAVRTHHAQNLARLHLEVDAVDGKRAVLESLRQSDRLDHSLSFPVSVG